MRLHPLGFLALASVLGACSADGPDDFDVSGSVSPVPIGEGGKEDGVGQPAIRVDADVSDTEVWKVRNQWTDRDETEEARAAGIAWPASSHLSWDEKYVAWIEAMPKIASQEGGSPTYQLITPYGKSLPSPSLECAETAMFLRATFAAWYGLPFFMEARDGQTRVFFGHFGVRTASGRWRSSPLYPHYNDYTKGWQKGDAWPSDSRLRQVQLDGPKAGNVDMQAALGGKEHVGAYLDEIFLNKRAGYFIAYLLDYFFSGSLADPVNTYNLKPEAIRVGDVNLHRYARDGIGHTLVVKHVTRLDDGKPVVELIAGSMPRVQGQWSNEVYSKDELIDDSSGGAGDSGDDPPIPLWRLGGGLKRWRVARASNGAWVNTFMPEDKASWISSTDGEHLKVRPKQFETLLGEIPPAQKQAALIANIAAAR